MNMRIGHGYDVHILVEDRKLMLGCTNIDHPTGLLGHSDADVLSHAIADSLLGACALGDIGLHFPDNSADCEGMSGATLLKEVARLIDEAGYRIVNIDSTVVAERPKLKNHILSMRENTAKALGIHTNQVSIKATTEEGRGITGNADAICAHAVALLCAK